MAAAADAEARFLIEQVAKRSCGEGLVPGTGGRRGFSGGVGQRCSGGLLWRV